MSIVVETGAGLADAESYESVAGADAHLAKLPARAAIWAAFSTAEKEQYLKAGALLIDKTVGDRALSWPVNGEQALIFPRISFWDTRRKRFWNATIPPDLRRANAEAAWFVSQEDREEEPIRGFSSIGVGSVQLVIDKDNPPQPLPRAVLDLLSPFLSGGGAYSIVGKAVR